MSSDTDALKGAILSAVDAYTGAVADAAVAAQQAADDAALTAAQGQIADLTAQVAELEAELAAAQNPPPPPPAPTPTTTFGFNVFNGWYGYTQDSTNNESSTTMLNRLKSTFGPFDWCKVFYQGFLPATWAKGNQGETDPANPARNVVITFKWTLGSIASGVNDALLTGYLKSIPAGWRVILGMNEPDNNKVPTGSWPTYVADMDHLYDLVESLNLSATVEVADCFMSWSLDPSSGPKWQDSWTNPKKRHLIVFDAYWNQSTVDKTGNTTLGWITTAMKRLGYTRWVLGETGDRRPGTSKSTETNDTTRAASLTNRTNAVLAADPAPDGYLWFDVVGSTGDHRILPADTATQAALSGFMHA